MFGLFKKIFRRKRKPSSEVKAFLQRQKEYIAMTSEAFGKLPEEYLYDGALARISDEVNGYACEEEGLAALNEAKRNFYVAAWYEMEVCNGGLCQFFVNSTRVYAPILSKALEAIGALEHKTHYDEFVQKNSIDTADLCSFDSETAEAFQAQYERYPFDEFDRAFYAMKEIHAYLTDYVKANISQF